MVSTPFTSRRQIRLSTWLLGWNLWWFVAVGCNPAGSIEETDPVSATVDSQPVATAAERVKQAARAIASGQLDVAEEILRQCLLADPSDVEALELSGDLAAGRGDTMAAPALYQSAVEQRAGDADRNLLDKWSKSLIRTGRPYDAIDALKRLIERFPSDAQARYDLAGLAAAVGVPEQALPALQWLVQRGQSDPEMLLVLADPARVEPDVESCERILTIAGEDRRAEFGLAKLDALHQDWNAVVKRLEPILSQYPDFSAGQALYGQAIFEAGDSEKFNTWLKVASPFASDSPLYWMVLGKHAQSRGRHEQAAKAFWESLRRGGVMYPEVLTDLLVSVHQLDRSDEAARLAELIVKQTELRDALKIHLERQSQSQAACFHVADAISDLGRVWEAEGWARIAVSLPNEKVPGLRERYMAIRNQLSEQSPWQLPESLAVSLVDLSDLSDASSAEFTASAAASAPNQKGQIRLEDQAPRRGWVHTSIPAPKTGGHTIEQSVGGGVAVIDFDCDGWPDLAAATLDGTALRNDSSPNRLNRNLNGSFVDVSAPAGYQDTGFGQGITVADYNEDGFADLLDANIGRNRLYRNNGDGTFTDVSDVVGLAGELWTTSVTMVDLDGDRITDLYEANYCAGRAPYDRECRNRFGLGTCSPLLFDAEPDRVWRGGEDGTFTDVTGDWMNQTSPGRGLGLVAGELDERPGIDVLVGNDMTVNHLWSSSQVEVEGEGQRPFQLTDLGVVRGLGTSGKSHSQASMGIAAADADGDGDLDLLMTHFSDDYNTYYEQVAPGFWSDRSYQSGLIEPSMNLLGFGTQWADLDNQGAPELIVVNGHVDRVDRDDVSYRMPPQLFSRSDRGRWESWDASALGAYFTNEHLGRAVVILDANRDGRCDLAVTHLDDPAALLINETPDAGRSIGVELKSTSSTRDAIGSRVTASIGTRKVVMHCTTGDGYMACNQRRVHIGCGRAESADTVTVHWPSGGVESFGKLLAGREYLLVEGSAEAVLMWEH